jgi:transposase
MRYIGVDLHQNSFTVAYQNQRGKNRTEEYGIKEIAEFRKRLRRVDEVAVEATGNTRYFVDEIKERVKKVVVVDPNKFEVIRKSVKKTDKHDARTLAYYLSKDMLPEARMKDKEQAQIHSLVQTRDRLVKLRTALMNKLHNICNGYGIKLKKESLGSEVGLRRMLELNLEPTVKLEVEVVVEQIRSLNKGIKKLEEELKNRGKGMEGYKNLNSIKGIGEKSATILLSVIGNVKDFKHEDKLSAYFGIVPRVRNSNETEHHGRITKRGTKIGRTTLVQCTLIAKRYSPYLQKHYERIKHRRGGGKAIIATSRKFLGIIYKTLKNDWVFEDFPNFVLASN